MGDIIIDLNHLAATIELPAEFVAKKMSFVEPLCAQLCASNAQDLRTSALRLLKLQHYFLKRPPSDNEMAIAKRSLILKGVVSRSDIFTDPMLRSFKGATFEERMKACRAQEEQYKEQETELFDDNPELWWQHRVQEAYNFERRMDPTDANLQHASKTKATGCIVPVVAFLAVGWWASRLILT